MKKLIKNKWFILSIAIVIILLLCLIFILRIIKKNTNNDEMKEPIDVTTQNVVISINPKIVLSIKDNKIINLYQLNEDASIFINEDFIGLNLDNGIKKIIELAKEQDYLKEDTIIKIANYPSETQSNEAINKIKNILIEEEIPIKVYKLGNDELEDIKKVINNSKGDLEEFNNESQTPNIEENNSNIESDNSNKNPKPNNSNDNQNTGPHIEFNGAVEGTCVYSMRGVNFKVPSWFTLYPGDRWATEKEYKRVNPDTNFVVYVRSNYNGYDDIFGSDEIYESYAGMFYQFLPDDINCLRNLCKTGDKDCYEEENYKQRTKLESEKREVSSIKETIELYESYITRDEGRIKNEEELIKKYCSEMTNEDDICVYHTKPYNFEMSWGYSTAYHKKNIKNLKDEIEGMKKNIENEKRKLHYAELRVYQQQKIYNFVKEHFPV